MTKPVNRPHKKPGRPKQRPQAQSRELAPSQSAQEAQEGTLNQAQGETPQATAQSPQEAPQAETMTELEKILAGRAGNPEKARTPAQGETARPGGKAGSGAPSRGELEREEARRQRERERAEENQECEDLAEILASGEAELAISFVPEEHQERISRKANSLLKTAYRYHFRQHGANIDSRILIALAHLGVGGMVAQPNREFLGGWASGFINKILRRKKTLPSTGSQEAGEGAQ